VPFLGSVGHRVHALSYRQVRPGTVFSRAWPDNASLPATAKATWRKIVLHPTTVIATRFGRGCAPMTRCSRTNRGQRSPNAAAGLRVVLAACRVETSLLGCRHANIRMH
jgi:hypothetical protein